MECFKECVQRPFLVMLATVYGLSYLYVNLPLFLFWHFLFTLARFLRALFHQFVVVDTPIDDKIYNLSVV